MEISFGFVMNTSLVVISVSQMWLIFLKIFVNAFRAPRSRIVFTTGKDLTSSTYVIHS